MTRLHSFFCSWALCAALLLASSPASAVTVSDLDAAIESEIASGTIPGAVLWIGRPGEVLHRRAYGNRQIEPARAPMELDTIFDAASLTKVVATTSAVMQLWEQGKIRLGDPVTAYLPKFQGGKSDITVRDLLTHFSGMRPDVDLKPVWSGEDTGIALAMVDKPIAPPGRRFIYSDINFILLAEIVRAVSGQRVDQYTAEKVFRPLGMKDTGFLPAAAVRPRIAPTERVDGRILHGVVHDPTTRYMGGVAGHAGLFTTAADLARFADMILSGGTGNGVRVLNEGTVTKMISPASPASQPDIRGLGWDIDSRFSSNRGELFPVGSFGHTGFTGTSLWIDPATRCYVILLTNSVHPHRKNVLPLRAKVSTLAAHLAGVTGQGVTITGYGETIFGPGNRRVVNRDAQVENGVDVMAAGGFGSLKGKRVGLITNHTGLLRNGNRNVDAMVAAGVNVTAIFAPEHGIDGLLDQENINDTRDRKTNIPVFSLYKTGADRRPTPAMLQNVDVLVFDIQDVGARFYTYISTMGNAMEEANKRNMPFFVLDRPNPITGVYVEGPMIDEGLQSFIGYHSIPLRHGMTIGELARMFHAEKKWTMPLEVVAMRGWQRGDWFDSLGQTWVNPSPNMRNLHQALLYTGVAMLESSTNYSVGRGTDSPFELVGADWIKGQQLAAYLNKRDIPGVRFYPVTFVPTDSRFKGERIEGVRILVQQRELVRATELGAELAVALQTLYPGKIDYKRNEKLIGHSATVTAFQANQDPRSIVNSWNDEVEAFLARRKPFLIYPER
ncbi:MAG: DUF1343 domain-containing protein [Bryobacterales bacterium]|nr:DUF1343 domain-containing protein [Bryobacterales bacterium]